MSLQGKNKAFTLIELLIGISIVAILAALLMAGAGRAIDSAESAKCLSNLRQIGSALASYAGENNGTILPRYANDVPAGEPRGWPARLLKMGYITQADVFLCPSFFPRTSREATKAVNSDASQAYGMRNWSKPGVDWGDDTALHKPLAVVEEPGDFFIVADSVWLSPGWYSQGYGITPGSAGQFVHLRHAKMANALFLDGHVEPKPREYFKELSEVDRQRIYMGGRNLEIGTTEITNIDELKNL